VKTDEAYGLEKNPLVLSLEFNLVIHSLIVKLIGSVSETFLSSLLFRNFEVEVYHAL
jgi:hypothetical protein